MTAAEGACKLALRCNIIYGELGCGLSLCFAEHAASLTGSRVWVMGDLPAPELARSQEIFGRVRDFARIRAGATRLLPYAAYLASNTVAENCVAINKAQFNDLIRFVLDRIEFDERWYRQTYSDVDSAIEAGEFRSGFEHYCRSGYFEGRFPRQILVDETYYLAAYMDVKGAIRQGKVDSAQDHFETYGFSEGRLPSEGWSL